MELFGFLCNDGKLSIYIPEARRKTLTCMAFTGLCPTKEEVELLRLHFIDAPAILALVSLKRK
jgi:hypothetical protein